MISSSTGNEPTVSVVIPTYNMEKHLLETLKSVSSQTLSNIEVIVIDDRSTDGTVSLIQQYCLEDSRVRLVQLESNSNRPAVPRNRGIAESRAKFVAFLDHDDLWVSWKLQRQVQVLEARPELTLVHSAMWLYPGRRSLETLRYLPNPIHRSSITNLKRWNAVSCSSAIVRRSALVALGGFDERVELRAIEDYHLWLRLGMAGQFGFITEIHGYYRTDPSSTYALEDMADRLQYLRSIGLIDAVPDTRRTPSRVLIRAAGYPASIYRYAIEAPMRRALGRSANVA